MSASINREYTGLARTPITMSWLIKKRAELQGALDVAKRKLIAHRRYLARARAKLEKFEAELAALPIEPTWRPTMLTPRLVKGRGGLRAMLLEFLAQDYPEPTCLKVLIERYVMRVGIENVRWSRTVLRQRIFMSLYKMEKAGLVARVEGDLDGSSLWKRSEPEERHNGP